MLSPRVNFLSFALNLNIKYGSQMSVHHNILSQHEPSDILFSGFLYLFNRINKRPEADDTWKVTIHFLHI